VSTGGPKEQAVRYWWLNAEENPNAARRDITAEDYRLAVSRLYYALFYAVSAVLLEEGHKFRKHRGVASTFNREIIRTGRLPEHHGHLYNQLFDARLKSDYATFAVFDEAYVKNKLQGCEAFLRDIRPLLISMPPDSKPHGEDEFK
jgi:uncharacterized protein